MPWYGCLLKLFRRSRPSFLSSTNIVGCHGKILLNSLIKGLIFAVGAPFALSQSTQPSELPPPPQRDEATVERPDFNVRIPRPNAPAPGDYDITADAQESESGVYHLHGHVNVELFNATFRADEAEYDESTKTFRARGNVYYRNYDRNEVIYCDRAEYNTDTSRGTFYHVRGYTKTKVVARPGLLTTQEPFYFEGAYAEKFEDKYLLHDGIITDCRVPNPWWTMHGKLFDIVPDDRAITHNGVFHLRRVPLFYFPYFYKGLKKEPRKSGFLTPNAGHSSQFGYLFGLGYYWAINRSFDAQYLFTDYTSRGYAHHIDFRGKPSQKTDFNLIFYGVQDRGVDQGGVVSKAPGVSLIGTAKAEFADGWTGRANIDYLSSFLFRQTFSNSFNEAIYSSTNSSGFLSKQFGYYTFDTAVSLNENFDSVIAGDSITIRKLPEFEFQGRDQQISQGVIPAWFSFNTSFGLYHRAEPITEPGYYETNQFTPRSNVEPTISSAFHWRGLNLVPSFTMHETFYAESLSNGGVTTDHLTRSAPEVSMDFLLPPIERIFDRKTFLGDKLKHVIEPRLTYRYVTGVNNFADTLRFDPTDLLSNTNELEIGITNRLYAKRGNTVSELLRWDLYQKRYFDPSFGGALIAGQRNVLFTSVDLTGYSFLNGPRHYSPIVSVLKTAPRPGVSVEWEADYDPLRHGFVNSMFAIDLRIKKYFVSAGHNMVRPDPVISPPANQVRGTVGYGDPNRKGWNSAFSTIYDYRQGILQFEIAQVTYNTNCCGISFEFRRFDFGTRNDNQYRIAFSIANIGTFGNLKKQERIF
jgi:LPS-assembly protein